MSYREFDIEIDALERDIDQLQIELRKVREENQRLRTQLEKAQSPVGWGEKEDANRHATAGPASGTKPA